MRLDIGAADCDYEEFGWYYLSPVKLGCLYDQLIPLQNKDAAQLKLCFGKPGYLMLAEDGLDTDEEDSVAHVNILLAGDDEVEVDERDEAEEAGDEIEDVGETRDELLES